MKKSTLQLIAPDTLFDETLPALLLKADAEAMVNNLVAAGAAGLSAVRALVESYYDCQHNRLEVENRLRALRQRAEREGLDIPVEFPTWLAARNLDTEKAVATILDKYTLREQTGMGAWAREVMGIGPIISAGLLALIDMDRATNPSKIWRFFGLDPTVEWKPGEKRPWNATGRTLCWKIGDSFCKLHNNPKCVYGKLYEQRKALELQRDANGLNASTAAQTLATRKFKDKTVRNIYASGHLPPGRIEQRARRWAVKLFLVEWWKEAFRRKFGREPINAYVIDKLGHTQRNLG